MNTAKKNQFSEYKMAISKDMNSILIGKNEFIDSSLTKNLYWSEPVALNYVDGKYNTSLETINAGKVLIVEVCQKTIKLSMNVLKRKQLESMLVLVFTEMSRDLIKPFLKTNKKAYLTTDLNDSNVINLLSGSSSINQSYSVDISNFLTYMEV
jgi:hypothetical protein